MTKIFSHYLSCVCLLFLLAVGFFEAIFVAEGTLISQNANSFSSNLDFLGGAHIYEESSTNGAPGYITVPENLNGRLSLIQEEEELSMTSAGIAYYEDPVRFLDPSTGTAASFNTSFTIDTVMEWYVNRSYTGDGLVFVISADNSSLGTPAKCFGFFDASGFTNFKSIVVEFDEIQDVEAPEYDISNNHVSFDFSNITWVAAADASDVGMMLSMNTTIYAWVEYSNHTQQLEARISYNNSRPIKPLLNYTVDLFDVAEEYMWVGFASGTGYRYSHYYIGNWVFESYGIPDSSPDSSGHKSHRRTERHLIVGICLGVLGLLGVVCLLLLVWRRSRVKGWRQMVEEDPMMQLEGMPERFSFKELSVATKSFSNQTKLGQGGFGSVHRGVLPSSGIEVAVKKINSKSTQGEKEFMAEMSIISRLRHRNLIQLLGWCKDMAREKYLLVYELMPNGSLDKFLFSPSGKGTRPHLSWQQRFNIVTGTAAAVDYLHRGWKQQVIHRDIKSSNIMLDGEWNAKLGDFGLARLVDHKRAANTTMVAGTFGYIAPEAVTSGRFTDKTDVFGFGAVVLEIACGRKAFLLDAPQEEMILVDWVWQSLSEGKLLDTVDKGMGEYDAYWMEVVLIVGLLCSHPNPSARPSMKHVVQVLAGDKPLPSIPASKPEAFASELPQSLWINESNGRVRALNSLSSSTSLLPPWNVLDSPTPSIARFKPVPFDIEHRNIWIDDIQSPKSRSVSGSRSQSVSMKDTNISDLGPGDSTVDMVSSKSFSSNSPSSFPGVSSSNI